MKFEIGDRIRLYNWQMARGIVRALGRGCRDSIYGISKESWNKWKNADDLTVDSLSQAETINLLEMYCIRSESLGGNSGLLFTIPAVCMYKK